MEGMELTLCFVTSLLSWKLLRFVVSDSFIEMVLDLNINLLLLAGNGPRSSPAVRRALFASFPSLILSNSGLATFIREVKNRRYHVFFNASRRGLFETVFGKEFCTNARMLRKCEVFSFHFYKALSFKSWIPSELVNFGFWVVFLWNSLWTRNQNSFKFPAFLELANSEIISFISDNFADRSTVLKAVILTFQCLSNVSTNSFNKHIGPKWKNV